MPRKPTHKSKESVDTNDEEVARLLKALKAICSNEGLESNPEDLIVLAHRFRDAGSVFCQYLQRAVDNVSQPQEPFAPHDSVASDLADTAREIVNTLLRYLQVNPEGMQGSIKAWHEWPVLAALDPAKDIRKVNGAPNGPAAQLYKPILEHLGTQGLFDFKTVRDTGFFHQLAIQASAFIDIFIGRAGGYRLHGLPWLLDFSDGSQFFLCTREPEDLDVNKNLDNRQWAIALKYYLYLTLAPEPARTRLRDAWRGVRYEAFATWRPHNPLETQRHQELLKREPLPVPPEAALAGIPRNEIRSFLYNIYFSDGEWSPKPQWEDWWELTLQYEPAALFGDQVPLVDWPEEAVLKIVKGKASAGRTMTAFKRCVDATLDAFLHLRNVKMGLKGVERGSNGRLPRIVPNSMIPIEGVSEEKSLDEVASKALLRRLAK